MDGVANKTRLAENQKTKKSIKLQKKKEYEFKKEDKPNQMSK